MAGIKTDYSSSLSNIPTNIKVRILIASKQTVIREAELAAALKRRRKSFMESRSWISIFLTFLPCNQAKDRWCKAELYASSWAKNGLSKQAYDGGYLPTQTALFPPPIANHAQDCMEVLEKMVTPLELQSLRSSSFQGHNSERSIPCPGRLLLHFRFLLSVEWVFGSIKELTPLGMLTTSLEWGHTARNLGIYLWIVKKERAATAEKAGWSWNAYDIEKF